MSSPLEPEIESIEYWLGRAHYWFEIIANLIIFLVAFSYYGIEMLFVSWFEPELISDSNAGMWVLILAAILPLLLVTWLQKPVRVSIIRFLLFIGKDSLANNINFGLAVEKYTKKLEDLDVK